MVYFIILNIAYSAMDIIRLEKDIEVFAGAFLVVGIIIIEIAYKKDSGIKAITGIEFLILALHSLSIMHVITLMKYDFRYYLLTSSYVISIYYVLKAIILYTKGRKNYLKSLSDISEIVKKEEPTKKEAKKREDMEKNEEKETAIETETVRQKTTKKATKATKPETTKPTTKKATKPKTSTTKASTTKAKTAKATASKTNKTRTATKSETAKTTKPKTTKKEVTEND